MQRTGTTTFSDAVDYQSSIREAKVNLVFHSQKDFAARLSRVELQHLRLLRGQENLPRVAHVSLPPDLTFIAFPTRHDPPQIWNGEQLQPGEIVFYGLGQSVHQRTRGPSQWALILLAPERLAACCKALNEIILTPSRDATILRPPHVCATRLFRLHAKACRLAETNPELIDHPEVARAIEQEVLHALVNCLTSAEIQHYSAPRLHHMKIIARFEAVIVRHVGRQVKIPKLCNLIGVSERTLRTCCAEFLGISPYQYVRLQHLNMVRSALRHANSSTETVADLARRYGFWELGRFAGIYRSVFGESPSATLRRAEAIARENTFAESA